jgi:formylglycine-generating enzyme required for sulfatase activity
MNSAKALKAHPFLDQKPSDGTLLRVLRGGSWFYSEETELQSTYHNRGRPTDRRDDVGFRCVLDISNDQTP